ncbi:DoxX family protein [Serratia marcescens]|nr:DoxX family protein [Serratia marcescens]MBH2525432.1 DoxX family protein [Serratia marcescens]MBH2889107.1 DoxX family protein [Serratia marcescens]MBH3135654.1 DoxX family protein [Serratia marcescens]MDU4307614.1 DoxX family protein [Serratia marcescens]HEJ7112938.1 DoxX family protein [Serratia marcescens]
MLANKLFFGFVSVLMRVLLSSVFIIAGIGKISAYNATAEYMASMGVPAALLPLVILTELGGGLALLLGFQTRVVSILFFGFCIISGLIFHGGSDQQSQFMLMKNITMSGGFIALFLFGPGGFSMDNRRNY